MNVSMPARRPVVVPHANRGVRSSDVPPGEYHNAAIGRHDDPCLLAQALPFLLDSLLGSLDGFRSDRTYVVAIGCESSLVHMASFHTRSGPPRKRSPERRPHVMAARPTSGVNHVGGSGNCCTRSVRTTPEAR